MSKKVRVRFAPSPTGGLHLGGVRTVLYNYLFAKQHGGDFIVRIEDTDQNRFVVGAEDYIFETLEWAGLEPDESVKHGGSYGPYRQSERKDIYLKYAEELVKKGQAYYAFDSPGDLEKMRMHYRTDQNPAPQYDHTIRMKMKNSLTLPESTVKEYLKNEKPVIRVKMPEQEHIILHDMIRGEVNFDCSLVDDKVLLKADGMPTYHLAVVVDDYLMKISHAFRGEEWLSSAPVHIHIWKHLFGLENMPEWAHFPLILGPNGKLSKRDAAKYGFPVFAMNWTDPRTNEFTEGFKEKGFIPAGFINMLALLGWNDGSEQEIFSKEELIEKFSMGRVHSGGAHFDYEKAKWFNHEWIKRSPAETLRPDLSILFENRGINVSDKVKFNRIIDLVKDRCTFLTDFIYQSMFFFYTPEEYELETIKPKWNEQKTQFFTQLLRNWETTDNWISSILENNFQTTAVANQLKPGEVLLPLRIMLVGGKYGPGVFEIASALGREETLLRIEKALPEFGK